MITDSNQACFVKMPGWGLQEGVLSLPKISSPNDQFNAVSGAGEPPPCALSDTDVNLSVHPAPIIQPSVLCPTANAEITRAAFWQFFPTKKPHSLDGLSTFSISSLPIWLILCSDDARSDTAQICKSFRSSLSIPWLLGWISLTNLPGIYHFSTVGSNVDSFVSSPFLPYCLRQEKSWRSISLLVSLTALGEKWSPENQSLLKGVLLYDYCLYNRQ